jgi:molecular chaperone GrpE
MDEDEFVVGKDEEENRKRQADSESEIVDEEERADSKVKKVRDELAEARAEAKANLDGWQRSKADYVNALRRFDEEKKSAKENGIAEAVEALLPAFDAIERAKEHGEVPAGFAGIVKQLEGAFASLGLTPVGVVGEAFNPEIHEAFGQDAVDDESKDDTVTTILETGWKRGEKIIRAAKVKVAKFG